MIGMTGTLALLVGLAALIGPLLHRDIRRSVERRKMREWAARLALRTDGLSAAMRNFGAAMQQVGVAANEAARRMEARSRDTYLIPPASTEEADRA